MEAGEWDANTADLVPPVDWSAGTIPGTTSNADPDAAGVAGSAGIAAGTGAGRYGATLAASGAGVSGVWDWLNTPFKQPLAPASLFLLVGVVLVAILAWNLILYHIRIAAETI